MSVPTPDEVRARLNSPGGWGQIGSSSEHERYAKPIVKKPHGKGRRRCHCGCGGWRTHTCFANGVALTGGCEMFARRWVRDGDGRRR